MYWNTCALYFWKTWLKFDNLQFWMFQCKKIFIVKNKNMDEYKLQTINNAEWQDHWL